MYLEEHVAQIDQKVAMHDQQIEILSKGLADLTVDVRVIRHDQTEGFAQVREQLHQFNEQVDKRFEQMDKRFEQMDKRFEQLEQTQALIVKLLTDRV